MLATLPHLGRARILAQIHLTPKPGSFHDEMLKGLEFSPHLVLVP